LKVAVFNVRGTVEQSARWKRAAEAEGYASAGSWLAYAADAYLKARARAGRPLPLAWHLGRFRVALETGETDVQGKVSPPFGVFRGSEHGLSTAHSFSLVHVPSRRIVATFRYGRDCRALAGEMAFLLLRDDAGALKLAELRERERT
jgi:hypothetical protein